MKLAEEFGEALRQRGLSCAVAESCTGGLIGHLITSVAGSSDYFQGGIIAYSNDAKMRLLDVGQHILQSVGAVSPETATAMAKGARIALDADVGIASTGIAGPGGATARKPVGLIYLAVAMPHRVVLQELHLSGGRAENIAQSAILALELARTTITESETIESE